MRTHVVTVEVPTPDQSPLSEADMQRIAVAVHGAGFDVGKVTEVAGYNFQFQSSQGEFSRPIHVEVRQHEIGDEHYGDAWIEAWAEGEYVCEFFWDGDIDDQAGIQRRIEGN